MIYVRPPTTTTMTDEPDASHADDDSVSAEREQSAEPEQENVQSLTDFFDQMDRAAFKRVLANRDAQRAELSDDPEPAKTQQN